MNNKQVDSSMKKKKLDLFTSISISWWIRFNSPKQQWLLKSRTQNTTIEKHQHKMDSLAQKNNY